MCQRPGAAAFEATLDELLSRLSPDEEAETQRMWEAQDAKLRAKLDAQGGVINPQDEWSL